MYFRTKAGGVTGMINITSEKKCLYIYEVKVYGKGKGIAF